MKIGRVNKQVLFNFVSSYIPVILLIFVVQTVSVFTILQGLEKNAMNVMQNAVAREVSMIEQKLQQTENVAYSISQNKTILSFANMAAEENFSFVDQQELMSLLSSYQASNTLFENIVVQNDVADKAVSLYAFYSKRINFYRAYFFDGDAKGDDISGWAKAFVDKATKLGLMQGMDENNFGAKATANRAQAITVIQRTLAKQ